jgi:dihydrofolate reductase
MEPKRGQDNPIRNVIFAINTTLDGCCDHTKTIADEEMLEYYTHLLRDVDLLVFGRKTYQLMVPYWPDVAKKVLRQKHRSNLLKHLTPSTKLFSHDH